MQNSFELLDVNQKSESYSGSNSIELAVHTRMEVLTLKVIINSQMNILSENQLTETTKIRADGIIYLN